MRGINDVLGCLILVLFMNQMALAQIEMDFDLVKKHFISGEQRCYHLEYAAFGPSESAPLERMKAYYQTENDGERVLFQVEDQITLLCSEGVLQIDKEEKIMLYSSQQQSNPFFTLLDTLIQSSINIKRRNTSEGILIFNYLFADNSTLCKSMEIQVNSEGQLLQIDIFYPNASNEANAFQSFPHLRISVREDLSCSRYKSKDLVLSTYLQVAKQGPKPTQEFADYELLSL
ncbi:hypothetical protein [Croceimicrobium hydrocarbonivorans]|uniref:Uncharacterized protein n=1 Tax=Croceimicrobium hydrocarbonivorans TaxID=2761580 RepID=A0A7H0VBW2_9FLAO|nr:hypothetical protein [Croceimicrobium hydrocarbonivorans]QNR23210.1 hypothetical protein H4K34_12600 [Croceimicrobium hydrocarbonivorans]